METIQQQKAALRRRLAAREQAMTQRERELSDRAIIYHVTRTEEYRRACTVFAFVGCGREIGTWALLERILSEGKELCVPLCTGPGRMECRRVQDLSVLRPGSYGIPEPPAGAPEVPPQRLALCVLPCLAAAPDGTRLGYGGGYYDRFLPLACNAVKIALCRASLLEPVLPRECHDVRADFVLSEDALYGCKGGG